MGDGFGKMSLARERRSHTQFGLGINANLSVSDSAEDDSCQAQSRKSSYFHLSSPSMIVMYRSVGMSVNRSVFPLGCGHFTSSQSTLVLCPTPNTMRGSC